MLTSVVIGAERVKIERIGQVGYPDIISQPTMVTLVLQTPRQDLDPSSPNISLNTLGRTINGYELWLVACIGITLQLAVLAFDAIITYHLQWEKGGMPIYTYAFPFTFLGTLGLVIGMYLCANIIEQSTKEEKSTLINTSRVLWIQRCQKVADQGFKSYAICSPKLEYHMTSRPITDTRKKNRDEVITGLASALSVGGKLASEF